MRSHKTEARDGMRIDWDVPVVMDDGLTLRAPCSRRRTGAGKACTPAAISKATPARRRSRNGWRCTAVPLTPGHAVELDIEIWPTCIVVPAGYRIALTIRGKD